MAPTVLACAGFAHAAPDCTLKLKGDDRMQFDLDGDGFRVLSLHHHRVDPCRQAASAGDGPQRRDSMTKDLSAIAAAGMKAGAAAHYVPKVDARVLAATALVGSGDAPRTRLVGSKPKAGSDDNFFCSPPAHSTIMKGELVVTR